MALSDKSQTREIDGVLYEVTPIPWGVGLPALNRLLRLTAPVLGAAMTSGNAGLFEALPAMLGDADVTYYAKILGDGSRFKNAEGNMQPLIDKNQAAHFDGRYEAFYKWLLFALEVNFAPFFRGMLSGLGTGPLAAVEAMISPSTATPGNG